MATCQKCNSPLEGDFGMVNCQVCGEVNFLDDGLGDTPPTTTPTATTTPTQSGSQTPMMGPPDWQNNFQSEETPDLSSPTDVVRETTVSDTKTTSTPPLTAQQVVKDITAFGNQPASKTEGGVLIYELQISGIDTLELRKALLESLDDPKFKWNIEELGSRIKNGLLTIKDLSPIKASLLVKKIRHLDLDVHWTQGNIYESPSV